MRLAKKDFEIDGIVTSSRVVDAAKSYFYGIVRFACCHLWRGETPQVITPLEYTFLVDIASQLMVVLEHSIDSSAFVFSCPISSSRVCAVRVCNSCSMVQAVKKVPIVHQREVSMLKN